MRNKFYSFLILIAVFTLGAPLAATAEQDRYYSDEELAWLLEITVEENVCGGQCIGYSNGWAQGTKKCADMTDEEKAALVATACGKADKETARRNANDNCLDRDESGNCLCANGVFSDPDADDPADGSSGKCEVSCTRLYVGTCSVLAAAAPDGTTTN